MTAIETARRVAVIAAMVQELQPVVRALSLESMALDGARAYRGRSGGREVVAAVTAMGTRAATDVTTRLLDACEVDHVFMIGICGGIDRRLRIGDLLTPEDVLDEATGARCRPTTLGGARPSGTLMTTDVLHNDPREMDGFVRQGIVAVDMETAAVGAVSEARGIPWTVYRAVSDWAGDPDVDADLVGLSEADGTPKPGAALRYVLRRPWRIPKLARLGKGMQLAVRASTAPLLALL